MAAPVLGTHGSASIGIPAAFSIPARAMSQLPPRPVPEALALPGLALIQSSSCFAVFHSEVAATWTPAGSMLRRATGVNSRYVSGVRPIQCIIVSSTVTMVIVWPSGVAVAPAVWPTAPLPPVRFTTVTGCPSSFSSSTATMRAMRSVPPPAAHGQMSWIGRLGYLACAAASEGGRPATSARHTKATTDERIHVALMRNPPLDGGHGTIAARMVAAHPGRTLLQKPPERPPSHVLIGPSQRTAKEPAFEWFATIAFDMNSKGMAAW